MATELYHEQQHLQYCLLHALNNLLQGRQFSKAELDAIADGFAADTSSSSSYNPLSLVLKPHRNAMTGNYDANVLLAALQSRDKVVVWHDRRNGAGTLDLTAGNRVLGIIVNFPTERFGGLWKGRHWIALRKIQGTWYNLDSDLPAPTAFVSGEDDVRMFLQQSLLKGAEAFIVLEG